MGTELSFHLRHSKMEMKILLLLAFSAQVILCCNDNATENFTEIPTTIPNLSVLNVTDDQPPPSSYSHQVKRSASGTCRYDSECDGCGASATVNGKRACCAGCGGSVSNINGVCTCNCDSLIDSLIGSSIDSLIGSLIGSLIDSLISNWR